MHGEYDVVREQLHFLGLWYNTARIAVENQGGYGDTRDRVPARRPRRAASPTRSSTGTEVRPADHIESAMFGFPMNVQTRPKVVRAEAPG
jgi:hypothetical protein